MKWVLFVALSRERELKQMIANVSSLHGVALSRERELKPVPYRAPLVW